MDQFSYKTIDGLLHDIECGETTNIRNCFVDETVTAIAAAAAGAGFISISLGRGEEEHYRLTPEGRSRIGAPATPKSAAKRLLAGDFSNVPDAYIGYAIGFFVVLLAILTIIGPKRECTQIDAGAFTICQEDYPSLSP